MNMFKGLLFLHGHFTRPEDIDDAPDAGRVAYGARTAVDDFARPLGNRAASASRFGRYAGKSRELSTPRASGTRDVQPARNARASSSPTHAGFLARLLYLGGRPMHAGHNFDIEEPFEQHAMPRSTSDSRIVKQELRRFERRALSARVQPQRCGGCG